ncbi:MULTISPECIES: His-Xaa-Ser system radical SAM maturase HxsC [Rhizobium]|uniref:His-Xaa-Ser system radical SAM maturase HxsC n=3 Tax=Rhizobium TaxID=379 RepID=A0A6P1CFU2_RHITR|nr:MULTISPECIES: His-Xaa-Ser system radical SAM maturase HxsC [Rhizobium]AGB73685.1 radical SAM superfamily protein [Rhizobium tropici CIAT 899]AYG70593.1 His-Xaa-Ser system radical SAM maturase HxsC [Rhizobium sp. CCGE531]ENN85783.1 radical SAM superfamily protein [Rhizobium freirei PRF 81]MBB4245216.1 His-Xaa-Ser system radical SAM maturase HxsC [Rhizobium tropici]MBB5596520.1 His-Xaa-Ser system radical SAM maturase HxsC [Rhizobium tropici]
MIDLRLKIDDVPIDNPSIVRLRSHAVDSEYDALLIDRDQESQTFDLAGYSLRVHCGPETDLDGDVLLLVPGRKSAHRLVRSRSRHNTFLVTEQCDQLCVMCSQPPKKYHADLFDQFTVAATLAPENARITISGGEPLLHKGRLFQFLLAAVKARPDISFHVLTNGQFFEPGDSTVMDEIGRDRVLWGIPLYAPYAGLHDSIVGKSGAFETLSLNLTALMRAGAAVELRTVVLQQNWDVLPQLANYVSTRLPFIDVWAIMQLENIGYGRMNWAHSFKDTSLDFGRLRTAINLAIGRGIQTLLYNFPLCSVPPGYRHLAPGTISDWKNKFLEQCSGCSLRSTCGGFFEWYKADQGFGGLSPQ